MRWARINPRRRGRGFTLLDLLLVIAIISILVGLAIPAVGAVNGRSIDAASMANMRTHAQVVHLYADDFRGAAPFLADPDATYTVARGGGLTVRFEFFEAEEMWVVALADRYYGVGFGSDRWDGNIEWSLFARPGPRSFLYQYSPTFFARPVYWNENTRDEGQLGVVRLNAVRYPSGKAVFLEGDETRGFPSWRNDGLAGRDLGWAFAFVDGSVRRPKADRLVRPCPLGEGRAHGGRFTFGVVGLHTQDGILGRDVE